MSENDDLERKRDELIERIKQVFPKNPTVKGKLKIAKKISYSVGTENRRLEAMFERKRWEEVIGDPSLVYNMTDVDHLMVITDDAYRYYLPALLVATLNKPNNEALYGLYHRLGSVISRFSLVQIDVLIEYFEFQTQLFQATSSLGRSHKSYLRDIEDYLLHLLFFRDHLSEKKAE
jgi:hypothetical protein